MAEDGPLPDAHARILADKLVDGQIALFVGAGLSHLCKAKDGSDRRLPLWNGLAEQVADACHEDIESYRDILDLFDAIEYGQSRLELEEAVRQALGDSGFEPSEAHQKLNELPWLWVITTNYDSLLKRSMNEEPVCEERDYDRLQRPPERRPKLFHIHGTL